jgi:hypothetical protein
MPLEVAYLLEPPVPDVVVDHLGRQALLGETRGVHANDEHLLVVGAVEHADAAAPRERADAAPEIVVVELHVGGPAEGCDTGALRVQAAHDVLDDTVLPRCVETL